jgi:predicted Zn-dependent protease
MKRLWLVLAVVAMTACEGPTIPPATSAEVYDFRLMTDPLSVLRWPSGSRVRVHVEATTSERALLLENALARGTAAWNTHALYGEYELVRATSLREADVLLRWSDEPAPVELSDCQPEVSIAVTSFCLSDEDPQRLYTYPLLPPHADASSSVRFVITILGGLAGQETFVQDLVMHELGHALGIAQHSPDPDDLMTVGSPPRRSPSPRDIATVQVLYHTRPDIVP